MTIAEQDTEFIPVVVQPLPDDAPAWAEVLNQNLGAVAVGVNMTSANLAEIRSIVAAVQREVGPVIDSLANHPMFKMFTGKRN